MTSSKLLGLAVVGAAALASVPAKGALVLTINGTPVTPTTTTPNSVLYTTAVGTFQTSIVVGYSNSSVTPTPGVAQLQIQSIEVQSASNTPQKLTIGLSDTGFTSPATTGTTLLLDSAFGGTLTGSALGDAVTFSSTASVGSTSYTTATQTFVSPATPLSTNSFSVPDSTRTFAQAGAFSLSDTLTLTLSNLNETANLSGTTTVTTAVPEPVGLTVAGIAGFGLLARRRRQA